MRRVLWLAPALALLSLGACAPTLKTQLVGASSGAPLAMPGYDWHLNEDAEEASLSYGVADTDDVAIRVYRSVGFRDTTPIHVFERPGWERPGWQQPDEPPQESISPEA